MDPKSLFTHVYVDHHAAKTLFLLHGTGGDEHDLLFFDQMLNQRYNVVGVRGNVSEDGMLRFFRRHGFGQFDQENIREETKKFQEFVRSWDTEKVFLGYSNGANMLLSTLFYYPDIITHAVLLHPMLPFSITEKFVDLSNHKFFVSIGTDDQMIPQSESRAVVQALESCGATPIVHEYPSGHEITQKELVDIVAFLIDKHKK